MHGLDGHYRHHGTSIHWDEDGVTLDRGGRSTRLSWEDVLAVRRLGGHPGYVQLMVRDHVPRQRLSEDQYTIPVNSDADANRLTTSLGWQARGRGEGLDEAGLA